MEAASPQELWPLGAAVGAVGTCPRGRRRGAPLEGDPHLWAAMSPRNQAPREQVLPPALPAQSIGRTLGAWAPGRKCGGPWIGTESTEMAGV